MPFHMRPVLDFDREAEGHAERESAGIAKSVGRCSQQRCLALGRLAERARREHHEAERPSAPANVDDAEIPKSPAGNGQEGDV